MKMLPRLLMSVVLASSVRPGSAQIQIHPLPEPKRAVVLPLGGHPLTAADVGPWLDAAVAPALTSDQVAGAVVVVVKDGRILYSKGYGYADVAQGKPVDPAATMFRVGSISKTFTWTAVMQLAERGKLDLDADVNRYLDFAIPPRDGQPITLRELMTHRAGFDDVEKHLATIDAGKAPDRRTGLGTWVKQALPARVYAANDVPACSDYGAALAGYIVQRVSGEPFDDYVAQHIFRPLGMRHATFEQPVPAPLKADLAAAYAGHGRFPQPFDIRFASPAGALSISGEDMAHFMIAHLQNGHDGPAQILQFDTARTMHDFRRESVPGLQAMALGFAHRDRNGQAIIGHDGDLPSFHGAMALYLQADAGLFVACACASDAGLRRRLIDGFADRYFPALPHTSPPTLSTAREHGALLAGRYLPSRTSLGNFLSLRNLFRQSRISMEPDGTLATPGFSDAGGRPRHWREVKPYLWLDDASGGHLGALLTNGRLRWVSIDEVSPAEVFLPVTFWQSAEWNLPLLAAVVLVLLAAVLSWPAAVVVQRLQRRPPALSTRARRWYCASRVAALLFLAVAAGWPYALSHVAVLSDSGLCLLQGLGWLAVIGIVAVAANAACAWSEPGRWWRRAGATALTGACAGALWFVLDFHLLAMRLAY